MRKTIEPGGEVAKGTGAWIDRACEAAYRHFISVAGVDDDGVGVGDQGIPRIGIEMVASLVGGVQFPCAQRHDLTLHLHLHAGKRRVGCRGIFDVQIRAARKCADMRDQGVDGVFAARDRAVNPFGRDDQRAAGL